MGGLGLRAAELLAECGACCVVLASRSGRAGRDGVDLEAHPSFASALVHTMAADGGDAADTRSTLGRGMLAGVLHASGVLCDKLVRSMAADDVGASFAPKAIAASHVCTGRAQCPLEALTLFSSVASTLGSLGQANYAAANAFLDALASSCRVRATVASSLQIPAVSGAGMGCFLCTAVRQSQR